MYRNYDLISKIFIFFIKYIYIYVMVKFKPPTWFHSIEKGINRKGNYQLSAKWGIIK